MRLYQFCKNELQAQYRFTYQAKKKKKYIKNKQTNKKQNNNSI